MYLLAQTYGANFAWMGLTIFGIGFLIIAITAIGFSGPKSEDDLKALFITALVGIALFFISVFVVKSYRSNEPPYHTSTNAYGDYNY